MNTSLTLVVAAASLLTLQTAASPLAQDAAALRVYEADAPGVTAPKPVQTPNPSYTPEAMRAKVQGVVDIEVTVGTDGRARDVMLLKSLDAVHGLDEQALRAASLWRFQPGSLNGQPVPVRTRVGLSFRLH